MMFVPSAPSISNQLVTVFKPVNIPFEKSQEYKWADEVLVISKPKITLIVTEKELRGSGKPPDSGAGFENNGTKFRNHDER